MGFIPINSLGKLIYINGNNLVTRDDKEVVIWEISKDPIKKEFLVQDKDYINDNWDKFEG